MDMSPRAVKMAESIGALDVWLTDLTRHQASQDHPFPTPRLCCNCCHPSQVVHSSRAFLDTDSFSFASHDLSRNRLGKDKVDYRYQRQREDGEG